jgi:hemolysin III
MSGSEVPARHERVNAIEEIANSLTHGVGLLLAIAGLVGLLVLSVTRGTAIHLWSTAAYGLSLVVLYGASTLYHTIRDPGRKRALRVVDHCAIYLLIAGSYTPFMLVNLRGSWGWSIFGVVWGLALLGLIFKLFFTGRFERLSLAIYLAMGWMAVLAVKPMLEHVPAAGLVLLAAGGLFYTAGTWFYARGHLPFRHAVWHLFVIGGSACHYAAVVLAVF